MRIYSLSANASFLLLSITLLVSNLFAQSPFIDQVPGGNTGATGASEERRLQLATGVRVVMRSNLGVVVRGEMLSLTKDGATIVTDRTRLKSPKGVEYQFSSIQSLNIPEHDLHWSKGEKGEDFLKQVSEAENILFENLVEFRASAPKTEGEPSEATQDGTTDPTGMAPKKTVITMQPAKQQPIIRPTVTVICGSCLKEVALSSDSGQECPHCKILWDSSPLDAAQLADLKQAEAAADAKIASMNRANSPAFQEMLNNGGVGNGELASAENGQAFQNNNGPGIAAQNPGNLAPQPVNAPPPIQSTAQPQEITLENLPLWMKVTVFGICLGVMYYVVFVR